MTDTTAQFKKQLPRNMVCQVLSFVLRIGIGLWLVPYLVHHLGRAAYGLIPIAGIMTQYVSLISQSISGAVSRFLIIALQRNDEHDANRIFNTAFFSYLALALLQIPVFGLVIFYANTIFTIPTELYEDVIILLICSAAAFVVGLVSSVFGVPIYANNRLDIARGLDIGHQVSRLTGIVVLFLAFGPALRYVGYVDLTISIVRCATTVVVGKWLAPTLRLDLHAYDWRKVRQLTAMGGWLLINYIGFLLFLRVDIWVCNRFVGADAAGDYAVVLQWSALIRQSGQLLSSVIGPMIVIYYARSEIERLIRLTGFSVRIFSLVMAIPISILCVFSSSLLTLWLGESFSHLAPLMVVMLCHLIINVSVGPLFMVQTAMNKVKWPALVTVAMGAVNIILAISFAKYFGWGIYGVAMASAIVLTCKNGLFTPIYGALILHRPWYAFLKCYVSGVAFFAGLVTLGLILNHYSHPESWRHLAAVSLVMGVVGLAGVWFILPRADRHLLLDLAPSRFRTIAARFIPA